jgi:exodeoxyribonuclease-1
MYVQGVSIVTSASARGIDRWPQQRLRAVRLRRSSAQDPPVTSSIFWYDYETTGINPRNDRPLQVAGIRTDHRAQRNRRAGQSVLPAQRRHPAASGSLSAITGITPSQRLAEQGLSEADFMTRVHAATRRSQRRAAPVTTRLRFDDEMTRYSLVSQLLRPLCPGMAGR